MWDKIFIWPESKTINWNGGTYRSFKMRHICNKVTLSTFSIVQYLMAHKNEKWPRDNKGRNYCKLFPQSLSPSDWSLWLAVARLSVFLPSPVAMLCTCLEARLWLGPRSALIPEPRPEQIDLLILKMMFLDEQSSVVTISHICPYIYVLVFCFGFR